VAADAAAAAVRLLLRSAAAPKSKTQFNGAGGLPTYISFTQGADDMTEHDKWISYSHWGMFPTNGK
jgi:hypothetical protein